MFTADMDFMCPPAIVKAIKRVAERGIYGYTSIVDDTYYRACLGASRTVLQKAVDRMAEAFTFHGI